MRRIVASLLVAGSCVSIGCTGSADRAATTDAPAAGARELVILVHGMGRTPLSMLPLERELERAGYRVLSWGYSSYCCTIAELGARLRRDVDATRGDAERIHFVGHSLGNILVRWVLTREQPPAGVGRVVMLAPPNQGSLSADRYARWFGGVLKPLPELTTDSLSTVLQLPVPTNVAIGIIAAERDGKVTFAQTRLPGDAQHITVPGTHTFIMYRPETRKLVRAFLKDGKFPNSRTRRLRAGSATRCRPALPTASCRS
jgi:pimeloyl-ACP methyl ester carboxylesterase